MTSIITLVKKGVGIAIIPDHLLKPQDNLKIYELKGLPKQVVFLSTLNFQTLPEHMKQLIDLIRKSVNPK
jgi:DNA-binding transcriptional LysR family regulator